MYFRSIFFEQKIAGSLKTADINRVQSIFSPAGMPSWEDPPSDWCAPCTSRSKNIKFSPPFPQPDKWKPPFYLKLQNCRGVLGGTGCPKPRLIYAAKKLTTQESQAIESIIEHNAFCCSVPLDIPELCQIITTDQRLTCSSPVEPRYYNIKRFEITLVCHQCGCELDSDAVDKFNELKPQWKTVLPACVGKCSNAPNEGWITKGATKKCARLAKRKQVRLNIDLINFRPPPVGVTDNSFQSWLAHSKPAWDELRHALRMQRQKQKRRKRE